MSSIIKDQAKSLDSWAAATAARVSTAKDRAEALAGILLPMQAQGHSLRYMAENLNRRAVGTPRGNRWTAIGISRTLHRLSEAA